MRPPSALLIAAVITLLSAADARAGEPLDGPELKAHLTTIDGWLQMRKGASLPTLTDDDLATLAAGEGVLKEQLDEGSKLIRATFFRAVEVEAWRLWVGLADCNQHDQFMPHVQESVILEEGRDGKLTYQYLSLPVVKSRQWVVRGWDNGLLWTASGKTVWESAWIQEPDAAEVAAAALESGTITDVTAEEMEDALFTSVNEGYWLLVELPDGRVLVAYQAFSDIGGKVPSWLINEMGPPGLARMVQKMAERGQVIETHYAHSETPPPAPDGSALRQLATP
jgi:hypothetical protein